MGGERFVITRIGSDLVIQFKKIILFFRCTDTRTATSFFEGHDDPFGPSRLGSPPEIRKRTACASLYQNSVFPFPTGKIREICVSLEFKKIQKEKARNDFTRALYRRARVYAPTRAEDVEARAFENSRFLVPDGGFCFTTASYLNRIFGGEVATVPCGP